MEKHRLGIAGAIEDSRGFSKIFENSRLLEGDADGGELTLFEGCLEGGAYPTIALADARSIMGLLFLSVFDTTGLVLAWWGFADGLLKPCMVGRYPGIPESRARGGVAG